MATINKTGFGKLSDGREATLYTLRNTKGATVKATNFGARLTMWRLVGRGYEFVNAIKGKETAVDYEKNALACGATFLPNSELNLATEIWTVQEEYEGVRFLWEKDGFKVNVLYSFSNDNELLIRYTAQNGTDKAQACPTTRVGFQLQGKLQIFADEQIAGTDIWRVRDVAPEIEMEPGMFGYDPTCPIDYLDAGLKKAAFIKDEQSGLELTAFTNMTGLLTAEHGGNSFALTAINPEKIAANTTWQGQTVFAIKLR